MSNVPDGWQQAADGQWYAPGTLPADAGTYERPSPFQWVEDAKTKVAVADEPVAPPATVCATGHSMDQTAAFCSVCGEPKAGAAPRRDPQRIPAQQTSAPYGASYGQPPYPSGPYVQFPAFQVQPARATNGLAIASMVLGILWVSFVGSILAVIFGHIALKQIRERDQSGRGMAIAGLVLGWIGVGVLALFILLLIIGRITSS